MPKLFIGLLPTKGCLTFAALKPQNFGVADIRHHFAVHNPVGGGLLETAWPCYCSGHRKDRNPPLLSVGSNPSLQRDPDVQQGLVYSWIWHSPSAQV